MSRAIKNLFTTDWEKELHSDETSLRKESGDEVKVVLLAGLQRLARLAGIVEQKVDILTPSDTLVQAVFTSSFIVDDEKPEGPYIVRFVGTADASSKNTSGKFLSYPTAVAESRAEARSLRKALGIRMLSSEEIGLREGVASLEVIPGGNVDTQVVVAIEKLCESRNIDPAQVVEEVVLDKARAGSICELSELTAEEAQRALSYLNEQKTSKKKLTAQEQRDQRKKELNESKS